MTAIQQHAPKGPGNVLSLERVSRAFGHVQALNPLNLNVSVGQVLGLLGPNGAGKTTLLSIMACTLAPSSGTVTVGGVASLDRKSVV